MTASPSTSRRRLLAGVALAWSVTMVHVVRSEMLGQRSSEDVRALVDAARPEREHARARYRLLVGDVEVGELESTVSGGQSEEQMLYVVRGTLRRPQPAHVRGFVIADWERRPERFVIEGTWDGQRHRLEGGLDDMGPAGVLFQVRYVPPRGLSERRGEWVLPAAPVLAPGPLPVPDLSLLGAGPGSGDALPPSRRGRVADPWSGQPVEWRVDSAEESAFEAAGRLRPAIRHDVAYGPFPLTLWVERSGLPLRLEAPGGVVVELAEESRLPGRRP